MLNRPITARLILPKRLFATLAMGLTVLPAPTILAQAPLEVQLKLQRPEPDESGQFSTVNRNEKWVGTQTAVIVCDVWDYHHSPNAVARLEQLLPRLDQVLEFARNQGAIIIHAPSDCMVAYEDHPARQRATTR